MGEKRYTLHIRPVGVKRTLLFKVIREIDGDDVHYYIGNPHKYTNSCVHVSIYRAGGEGNKKLYGQIDHLMYEQTCTIDGRMEQGNDTRMMLMGALLYIAKEHPEVDSYSLQDEADKLVRVGIGQVSKRILITPRRLLQGKMGWYQEHFGAIPEPRTERLVDSLKKRDSIRKIKEYMPITQRMDWGEYSEISEVASRILPKNQPIHSLWGTTWYIPRDVILSYAEKVSVHADDMVWKGGALMKSYRYMQQKHIIRYRS